MSSESREFIEPLADHLADRTIAPAIGQSFDLDQVPTGIAAMEAGKLTAKTVIKVKA